MATLTKFFTISVQITKGDKRHWTRIGSAALLPDGSIGCTLDTTPLNWTGEMRLFPVTEEKESE